MGQNVEGYFGYGIYLGSPDSDAEYYSRLKNIYGFLGLDGNLSDDDYEESEYKPAFTEALNKLGLEIIPQYSYEARSFCLIVRRSLVKAFDDPEAISIRHIEDRTGYEIMDKLADHLEMSADYMVWGFYG